MRRLTDHDAFGHPAYDDAVARAVERAASNLGNCFSVYGSAPQLAILESGDV